MIRKACRDYPEACVIITGCYVQLKQKELEEIENRIASKRTFVVSGDNKSRILDLPKHLTQTAVSHWELSSVLEDWFLNKAEVHPEDRFRFHASSFSNHSRAFLKIQDGCNNACTFCAVHFARGKSVSLAAEELLRRLQDLEAHGYGEAVLTGVNINQYFDGKHNFAHLLTVLLNGTKRIALRLSSIEPDLISADFLQAISHARIRPHFHLSVQSGSDAVLTLMGRKYTKQQVLDAIETLREAKDDPFIACDIISGFPGEDDSAFEETVSLCEKADFSWIHAFPFSPRPGTAAANLPHHVPERIAVERVERLILLAKKGREDYIQRNVGKQLDVIVEDNSADSAHIVGMSENYLRVLISQPNLLKPGTTIPCKIISSYKSEKETDAKNDDSRIDAIASPTEFAPSLQKVPSE
jgi:threonylcarbamoyladenosine tRNA methylthiotransferase MtaB